nr:hypothetical protein [Tanacetum cinerariifolium]
MNGFRKYSSCGALYTNSCACSKGGFAGKFVRNPNKTPSSSQRLPQDCPKCGNPVDGLYCRHCALLRKKLKEVWFTICDEHKFFQDFLNTSESSNDDSNIVNAPQDPIVINQDPGENSSQSPPQIDHQCCYGCGDPLNAWDRVSKIKNAFGNKQYKSKDVQELFRKLFNNVQNIHEELAEYINIPSWNRPAFSSYDDDEEEDYTIAITPEEPDNSLSMRDEHLDTIPATESNKVIKSTVENLVPTPSESEGILDNTCDVLFRDNYQPLDVLKDQFEEFFDSNDDSTSIDDNYFCIDNIDYFEASPPDSELVSLKEVEDDNLREKLLNINLLIAKIKSLNDNPTPDHVLKPLSLFPIPIEDNDSFLEKSDTSLSYSDNFLPKFKTFSNHTKEKNSGKPRVHVPNVLTTHPTLMLDSDFIPSDNSLPESKIYYFDIKKKNCGSTTIHANISLPDLECFKFKSKSDPGELKNIVDSAIRENVLSATNVNLPPKKDYSPLFAYVVWIFLSFLTYPVNMTITRSGMTLEAIEELVNRRVEEAFAAYEATRAANALELKTKAKRVVTTIMEMGGMEIRTVGIEAAFAMSWRELLKLIAEVYCLRNEIQRIESELWNLTAKNNDLAAYIKRFQELTIMCTKMVPEEEDQVERFIGGLLDNIQRNVIVVKPTRLQDAICIANNLIDQKLKVYVVKNAENKKRLKVKQRDNRGQQPPFKRRNVRGQIMARVYLAGNNLKRGYDGPLPYYSKCCVSNNIKNNKDLMILIWSYDLDLAKTKTILGRIPILKTLVLTTQRALVVNKRVPTCFECGRQGYYSNECLKLKNQNRGNKYGKKTEEARGKAYVLGGGEANLDSNVVTGTFLLNNHYASIIFDSGADRSFVSSTFSTLLDITPDTLDVRYAVKLADETISESNIVLKGCTLGVLGHPFNIDLMPVEVGSFDVIISMDWLTNHHVVIVCDEKIVRIPYGDEVLIVQGQRELEARVLIAGGEGASLLEKVASLERSNPRLRGTTMMESVRADRDIRCEAFGYSSMMLCVHFRLVNMTITRSGMTLKAIKELVNRRVEEAFSAYEATRVANALEAENQSQNGSENDNGNGRNGNGGNISGENVNGENRNGENGNGENGNPNENDRGARPRTVGTEAAFTMSWRELMKLMAEVYCPRNEIQRMESELLNLTVERFIGGLLDNIQGNVIVVEPTRLQDVVCIANNLMDQKLKGYPMKNAENKRRFEVNQRDNRGQQPPCKRQNVGGQNVLDLTIPIRSYDLDIVKMKTILCRIPILKTLVPTTQRALVVNQRVPTCFECGRHGHYRNKCPKLKNQNRGNKAKKMIEEARGKAYVLGGGEANLDLNVVTGTFLQKNHYASMIFDSSADRSFVSSTFSTLLDITPDTLDVSYAVELANGGISETNIVLRGCTLGLLGHPLNIDLMPVELGSFDVIIGMDWLANHHAVIVCDEKIVRIPYGDEVLIVQEAIEELINRRMEEAFTAYEATRATNALEAKNQSQNGNDNDNGNGGNRNGGNINGENVNSKNGNGENGIGGNGNPNENDRGARLVSRECTYQDFMKCQPINFKGTEGVVGLIRWFVKMEIVFHISNCPVKYQVKELMELMAEVYCPINEIQRMESELWNLTLLNNDLAAYTQRFQELNMMSYDLDLAKTKMILGRILILKTLVPTTQRALVVNQRVLTCFECGRQGHYRNECPKLKNQNCGNKAGKRIEEARGKAYVLGGGEANLDSNIVMGTFLLNNHDASMIFDSGADRSFVSSTFSTLLNITPDTLDVSYAVELANGRISETS